MTPKIATCCYCGTRAALVLDRVRHELACSRCAAPLLEMKAMPKREAAAPRPASGADRMTRRGHANGHKQVKARKSRQSLGQRLWKDVWERVEDLLD
jgi:hypothetical protein